jgi:hypothetical protein
VGVDRKFSPRVCRITLHLLARQEFFRVLRK